MCKGFYEFQTVALVGTTATTTTSTFRVSVDFGIVNAPFCILFDFALSLYNPLIS